MLADDVMVGDALSFDRLIHACAELESTLNNANGGLAGHG